MELANNVMELVNNFLEFVLETSSTMELVDNVMELVNIFLELVFKNFRNGACKQFSGARKQCAPVVADDRPLPWAEESSEALKKEPDGSRASPERQRYPLSVSVFKKLDH